MEYAKPEVRPFDSLSVLVDGEQKTFETIFAEFESAQERKASSTVLSRLVKRLTALYNPLAEWAKEYEGNDHYLCWFYGIFDDTVSNSWNNLWARCNNGISNCSSNCGDSANVSVCKVW